MITTKLPPENKDPIRAVFDLDNLHDVGLKGIDVIINGETLSFSKDNVERILTYLLDMGLSKEREIYWSRGGKVIEKIESFKKVNGWLYVRENPKDNESLFEFSELHEGSYHTLSEAYELYQQYSNEMPDNFQNLFFENYKEESNSEMIASLEFELNYLLIDFVRKFAEVKKLEEISVNDLQEFTTNWMKERLK